MAPPLANHAPTDAPADATAGGGANGPSPDEAPSSDSPVVVVGGGLAGLTAALDLADANVPALLLERRPYPGGKTFSFTDPDSGVELDNGQHVILRCCTAYLALIERLDLSASLRIQPQLHIPLLDTATGRRTSIASNPAWLPAPLNLAWSLLRFPGLSRLERLNLGRAVWPMRRLGAAGRRRLDDISFADWLRAHGQSDRSIERLWDLIVLPTCNDRSEFVSARQAIMVFQVGLLHDRHGADLGLATVGLSTIADAALAQFRAAGGVARLGRAVRALDHDGDRVTGVVLSNDERIAAVGVVLALPPNQAASVLPQVWRSRPGLAALTTFAYAPIVNVHLHWDRPLIEEDFIATLDPALQYVFNRSRILGLDPAEGQWLTCSISGADREIGRPQQEIADGVIDALRRAFPAAREARVLHWRVVKEPEATFRPRPGLAAQRPGARTDVGNLLLAGAWTDTEWPATMESAVRSGHAAAGAWLAQRG